MKERLIMIKTIEVTQNDIDDGVRGNCANCPVALAIGRAFKSRIVSVGAIARVHVWETDRTLYATFPENVYRFMGDFDNLYPVKPFSFEAEFVEKFPSRI